MSFSANAEETKIITSYLVRCTTEQKEFLQKTIAESGQAAAQFLVEAASFAAQKSTTNVLLDNDLVEVDALIARLSRIIKAKIYLTCEKEKQYEEKQQEFLSQKQQIETQLEKIREENESELNEKRKSLELEYQSKKDELQNWLETEKHAWQTQENLLIKENKNLQEKIQQKIQESHVREKQYADSVKLHQNIEERNNELKIQNEELKLEILELKKQKETHMLLQKERDELKMKIEILSAIHEQEIRNLQGEFALKAQILTHEVEKRFLNPTKNFSTPLSGADNFSELE